MTQREKTAPHPDRSQLKPVEAACFPAYLTVRTDKPGGLVAYQQDLVGFEATNVIIRFRAPGPDEPPVIGNATPHVGPLSLLFAVGGRQSYEIEGRRLVVDDSGYVIHNLGQTVADLPEFAPAAESYTIGFWPGVVEEVLRSLVTPQDHLLDNPAARRWQPVRFFDQLYPHSPRITPLLARVRASMDDEGTTQGFWEELNYQLLTAMLDVHRGIGKQIEALPPVRAATRLELYRRLHRARDFMEAQLDQPLTIPQIAQEAWLSPYYFLRQFQDVFGETPHNYLRRRRLEWARQLLTTTDQSVTEICFTVGFESVGSFSSLFRRYLGMAPQQFRLQYRSVPQALSVSSSLLQPASTASSEQPPASPAR